jgi:hypothetical protein
MDKRLKPFLGMALAAALNESLGMEELLPKADCTNCKHGGDTWKEEDCHCYMFKEKPEGNRCGQFKKPQPYMK